MKISHTVKCCIRGVYDDIQYRFLPLLYCESENCSILIIEFYVFDIYEICKTLPFNDEMGLKHISNKVGQVLFKYRFYYIHKPRTMDLNL